MTVEQIALRQEVRQLLNEAGINRNTLQDIVREVIDEELTKAVRQVMQEMNLSGVINQATNGNIQKLVREELRNAINTRVNGYFNKINVSVDILNSDGDKINN
jgi:hypothetical protein